MATKTHQLAFEDCKDGSGRDLCVRCVEQRIKRFDGVQGARVVGGGDSPIDDRAVVELEYDPRVTDPEMIDRGLAADQGCVCETKAALTLPIEGLVSARDEHRVQTVLEGIEGLTAKVSFESQSIDIEFDRRNCHLAEVVQRLDGLGIRIKSAEDVRDEAPKRQGTERWIPPWLADALCEPQLVSCLVGGVFLVAGALVHGFGGASWLRMGLLAVSYAACGWGTAKDVVKALRSFRFDIDVLMFAAAIGAASLGHYEEGGLLLLLFGLGGAGQRLAMRRARGAISALTAVAPQTATLVDEMKGQREVRVEDLRVGDLVLVRPGQRIPADGTVVGGRSVVDQAPITGESVPVDKAATDQTYAGTINGDGALTIEVGKLSSENTISKVIRLVEQAQVSQSPTQLFTQRVEKWYVPFVLVTTAGLIVVPPVLGVDPAGGAGLWGGWFYQAMAFLTAASPCALAIGTPAAVLSGIGRAARGGVLIKGGAYLEVLGRVRAMAFDKTGTLTMGRHEVTDVECLGAEIAEREVLALAAALERSGSHPLATAVVAESEARQCDVLRADQVEQVPGMGVGGVVDGRRVLLGRLSLIREQGSSSDALLEVAERRSEALQAKGRSVIAVAVDGRIAGLIGLIDRPRATAGAMVAALHGLGIKQTVMLTGDNARVAAEIAGKIGIDQWQADLLPEQKLEQVRELNRRYGRVAMVGDGVNDAPALAGAAVGIAMGGPAGGGTDVALETADVALLSDDLKKVPEAIGISRMARRIILQNLVLALGVIAVLAPLAAMGFTTIYAAVLFHEGSTVLVVLNGLRILGYREPPCANASG